MAREQKAVADLHVDDKVYTPTSRHPRSLLAIDRRDPDATKLMFLETTWVLPPDETVDVQVEDSGA